jgi:hypothetical protein
MSDTSSLAQFNQDLQTQLAQAQAKIRAQDALISQFKDERDRWMQDEHRLAAMEYQVMNLENVIHQLKQDVSVGKTSLAHLLKYTLDHAHDIWMSSEDGQDSARIPKIMRILTGGGKMTEDDLLSLGQEVAQRFRSRPPEYALTTTTTFNGQRTFKRRLYHVEDVPMMAQVCMDWLGRDNHRTRLVYD